MKRLKQSIYLFWMISIVGIVGYIVLHPDSFSPENITNLLRQFEAELLFFYSLFIIVRGLFLLPITPFIVAGVLLFPDQPGLVLLLSMISILVSSTAIYYFSDLLGFSGKLEARFPERLAVWKRRLSRPTAVFYVLACSLVPIFSNELICYVAGIVKMPFPYLIFGVLLSSFLLFYVYIYFGANLMN
ncbi:MAG: VTT domain-containing protein [Bacteroidota bacterium]